MTYLARPNQPLLEHLQHVAEETSFFCKKFAAQEIGFLAGLWHDLGKYHPDWQSYIHHINNGGDKENAPSHPTHAAAGALFAKHLYGDIPVVHVLEYLIACHHTGLKNGFELRLGLDEKRKKQEEFLKLMRHLPEIPLKHFPTPDFLNRVLPDLPKAWLGEQHQRSNLACSLWIRMVFSALIDADRLDASRAEPTSKEEKTEYASLAELKMKFNTFMKEKTAAASQSDKVLCDARQEILASCRQKAEETVGLFSLTVPTGGGKTLASMAFALEHALIHGLKRIIYVIPYTSIIEQNARVFKNIFGERDVIEHHSNVIIDGHNAEYAHSAELATENWDAPIIVTTNVQFFESLFAAKTSRLRKIHNIAEAVVVLDEAQMLPLDLLAPTLQTLDLLSSFYRTSIMFCTATQPFLTKDNRGLIHHNKKKKRPEHVGLNPQDIREIITNPHHLAEQLQRVDITYPAEDALEQGNSYQAIAKELATYPQVLSIVNTRQKARELFYALKSISADNGQLFHLSALMSPEHRSEIIKEIKQRLAGGLSVQVISTQLVEAGVDIDFPVVYREMAGLDSIAQAAGRCNREGKLGYKGGKLKVFLLADENGKLLLPLLGQMRRAFDTTKKILRQQPESLLSPDTMNRYYEYFFADSVSFDKKCIIDDLAFGQHRLNMNFADAAEKYRLIEDDMLPVIVWHNEQAYEKVTMLCNTLQKHGYQKWIMRALQRHIITIPYPIHKQLEAKGDIKAIITQCYAQISCVLYDKRLGFISDNYNFQNSNAYIV